MILILYQYNPLHITVLLYNRLNHLIMILQDTILPLLLLASVSCSTTVSDDTLQYTFTGLDHTLSVLLSAINCAGTGDNISITIEIVVQRRYFT